MHDLYMHADTNNNINNIIDINGNINNNNNINADNNIMLKTLNVKSMIKNENKLEIEE